MQQIFAEKKRQMIPTCVWGCLIGVLTHGFYFLNKFSYHDDAYCLFAVGATFDFGRWGLGILGMIMSKLFGGYFSIPLVNGLLSVMLLAVSGTVICEMFDVKNRFWTIAIVSALEAFPAVTATYAYMFTAPYYMAAVLLAVLSARLCLCKKGPRWVTLAASALSLAVSVGIYQAYFAVAVSLLLIEAIVHFWDGNDLKIVVQNGVRYLCVLASGMLVYLCMNRIFLRILNMDLSGYAGIDNMLDVSAGGIAASVGDAYRAFAALLFSEYAGLLLFPFAKVLLIAAWILTLYLLIRFAVREKMRLPEMILYGIAILLLPLAFHLVNVMITGGGSVIHTLMAFAAVFELIFPMLVFERFLKIQKANTAACVGVLGILVSLVAIDNQAYLRAYLVQKEADSYFGRLITRIQMAEGYQSPYPVYYYGELGKDDDSLTRMDEFSHITMTGFDMTVEDLLNDYARTKYLAYYLGYEAEMIELTSEDQLPEGMMSYPNDGSICVENGSVWVKFSE